MNSASNPVAKRGTVTRVVTGFRAPWRGLKILFSTPKLWIYSLPPFLLSGATLLYGFSWIFQYLPGWLAKWLPDPVGFFGFLLHWTGMLFGVLFSVVAVGLISLALVQILAIPFNALLAEKTMAIIGGFVSPSVGFWQWIKQSVSLLRISLMKSILFLIFAVILFVLSLIPGVQVIAVLIGLILAAFDCTDYSLEVRQLNFSQRMKFLRQHVTELFGFGLTLGTIFLIPGLNLFFLPAAVVGGALLVLELDKSLK